MAFTRSAGSYDTHRNRNSTRSMPRDTFCKRLISVCDAIIVLHVGVGKSVFYSVEVTFLHLSSILSNLHHHGRLNANQTKRYLLGERASSGHHRRRQWYVTQASSYPTKPRALTSRHARARSIRSQRLIPSQVSASPSHQHSTKMALSEYTSSAVAAKSSRKPSTISKPTSHATPTTPAPSTPSHAT